MDKDASSFWKSVNSLIKSQKTKQESVASLCNISYQTFRGWVARKTFPSADEACRIAKVLGVSVEYLVTGEDPSRPDILGAIKKIESGLDHLRQVEDLRKAEILVEALRISGEAAKARLYLNGDINAESILKAAEETLRNSTNTNSKRVRSDTEGEGKRANTSKKSS